LPRVVCRAPAPYERNDRATGHETKRYSHRDHNRDLSRCKATPMKIYPYPHEVGRHRSQGNGQHHRCQRNSFQRRTSGGQGSFVDRGQQMPSSQSAGEIRCQIADQSNAVVPSVLVRTSEARSMPTVAAKSRLSGHPSGKWRAISRFDPNRTTFASTQPVLTGLSIRIDSCTARSMGFSASTNAPFRLMLINVAPILRRPSGASNWRLDRFFTTSQRGEDLRSSG
jgi:hypothetical protein